MPQTLYSERHVHLVELLRRYRTRAGLTQTALAERLGRPQSFVSKYESGQRRLDLVELETICQALDVSVMTVVKRWSEVR